MTDDTRAGEGKEAAMTHEREEAWVAYWEGDANTHNYKRDVERAYLAGYDAREAAPAVPERKPRFEPIVHYWCCIKKHKHTSPDCCDSQCSCRMAERKPEESAEALAALAIRLSAQVKELEERLARAKEKT